MLNSKFLRGKNHKFLFQHPEKCKYKIGQNVQFLNRKGIWVNAVIVGFNIKSNRFQAIMKCSNKRCKTHIICINSIFLKKVK